MTPSTRKAVREALDAERREWEHYYCFSATKETLATAIERTNKALSADEASQQECPRRTCSCLEFWDSHPPDCPCCGKGQQDREAAHIVTDNSAVIAAPEPSAPRAKRVGGGSDVDF